MAEQLTKHYGRRCVVNQLNLAIPAGTVYGFLGRNGAGKSTTIRMLLGMTHPTYGRAALLGHDVNRLPAEVRGRIAYLAEGFPLYGWMTVAEATRFSRRFHAGHWNQPLLDHVLEHFRLPRRQKIRRLSQGQRAQVALGLAIAPDPDLLILDDPTLGLDTVARREFLVSLIQLIQREGRTIFYSSHILVRRRTRGRSHRHSCRRRAARRLPHGMLQAKRAEGPARIRRAAAQIPRLRRAGQRVGNRRPARAGDRQFRRRATAGHRIVCDR